MERPSHVLDFTADPDECSNNDIPPAKLARKSQAATTINGNSTSRHRSHSKVPFSANLTSFGPLESDKARCTARGRPNYYRFRSMLQNIPLQVCRKFILVSVLKTIAENTNAYALSHQAGTARRWTQATWKEIQCFFGIVIYMGVYRCARVEDYWDFNGHAPRHAITKAISLVGFQQIKRFIHICHPTSDNGKSCFFKGGTAV